MNKLSYDQGAKLFTFSGQHPELKAAGFRQTAPGVWVTASPYGAALFHEWADASAAAALADVLTRVALSRARDSVDDYPCPAGEQYLPFQRAGIQYALAHDRVLIADEMGLGKTVQALGVANAIGAKSILVVCPASIRRQWINQARRWLLNGKHIYAYPVMNGGDKVPARAGLITVSYDLLRSKKVFEQLVARTYDLLVLDEAHYVKNYKAARTRAVFGTRDRPGIVDRAKRVVALTGTPLLNRPEELYSIVRSFAWHAIDRASYADFVDNYDPPVLVRGSVVGHQPQRLAELQMRLRAHVMIRRTKAEVATELPAKTYEIIEVEETGEIRKALQAESLLAIDPLHVSRLTADDRAKVTAARREMGLAKAPHVVEHVLLLLDGGVDKLVVFAWHRDVISAIAVGLERRGKRCFILTGATPGSERDRVVADFVGYQGQAVFIAQLVAGGAGIDGLQHAANVAVFAECSWTFGHNEQAADRLHRGGQALPVTVQFIVAPKSLDARVLTAALTKYRLAHVTLDKKGPKL